MEFKEIATVAGKPGLYKILKPSRSGVILESMDDKKTKLVVGGSHRVSILSEISIYTLTEEGAAPLEDVMRKIEEEFQGDTGLASDADNDEYHAFLKHILPEYDESRVYVSDIKKLISWYKAIRKYEPELLQEKKEEETKEEKEDNSAAE
jgi:DNA-binding PadR family transcriptional regulator